MCQEQEHQEKQIVRLSIAASSAPGKVDQLMEAATNADMETADKFLEKPDGQVHQCAKWRSAQGMTHLHFA